MKSHPKQIIILVDKIHIYECRLPYCSRRRIGAHIRTIYLTKFPIKYFGV